MSRNTDHLKLRNAETGEYEMICEHCGLRVVITPPIPMERFVKMIEKFGNDHAHCLASTPVGSYVEGVPNLESLGLEVSVK